MAGDRCAGGSVLPPPPGSGPGRVPAGGAGPGRLVPLLPGLFAALTFGAATPASKVFLEGVAPAVAAAWLYLSSGIVLSVALAISPPAPDARVGRRDLPWMIATIVVGGVAAPVAFFLGLAHGPASDASLLLGLELPLTVGIAVLLFGERLDRRRILGAALVTAGGLLVATRTGPEEGATSGGSLVGALWIGAACLGWALDGNLTRFLAHRSPFDVARWKGIGGGLVGFGLAAAFGAERPSPTAGFLLGGAAVGVVAYGLSLAGYVASVRRLGAARTGMLFGAAPLFGLAGSAWVLGEPVGWRELGAAALVLAGVTLLGIERRGEGA